jgi:spermidine/putrescine transport system permease protein
MFSPWSVGLGMVYDYLPLMILPLFVSLERLDRALLEASKDLGAGRLATFWHITLPLALPGLVAGTLLVFIPLSGEYIVPALLGGNKIVLVGNVIIDQFGASRDWAFAAALGNVLALMVLSVVIVYLLALRGQLRRVT